MTFILVTKLRVCLNNKKRRTYTYINLNHKKFDIIEIKVLNIKDLCLSLSPLSFARSGKYSRVLKLNFSKLPFSIIKSLYIVFDTI